MAGYKVNIGSWPRLKERREALRLAVALGNMPSEDVEQLRVEVKEAEAEALAETRRELQRETVEHVRKMQAALMQLIEHNAYLGALSKASDMDTPGELLLPDFPAQLICADYNPRIGRVREWLEQAEAYLALFTHDAAVG